MLLEMFVNELSLAHLAVDEPTGQERVRQYVLTMRAATIRGVQRTLRLPEDFYAIPIAPDYYWQSWLSDNRVERELRHYFLSLATKIPFLNDEPTIEAAAAEIDCFWNTRKALGLKAAYLADGFALSMPSHHDWDTDSIQSEVQEIIDGDVTSRIEAIHHASAPHHIDSQSQWIHLRIQQTVASGSELWDRMEDFFPSLTCCSAVEGQLVGLPTQALASVIRGLFRLNAFCVGWIEGAFDPNRIECDVSSESEPTLNRYANERTFLCPDGEHRIFAWHAKVGSWRIHFNQAPGPGRLFVGYIGKHLRTVRFH